MKGTSSVFVWRRRVLAGVVVAIVLVAGYFLWFRDSSLVAVDDVEVQGATSNQDQIDEALTQAADGMSTLNVDEEALARAVSSMTTPVVSAIGHEPDNPVLDNVADLRAATPTDAAKRVVPDVAAELSLIAELRGRAAGALRSWVANEQRGLASVRSRPVLADPMLPITRAREVVEDARSRNDRALGVLVRTARHQVESLRARVNALGPSQTLRRGYAVVQAVPRHHTPHQVITTVDDVEPGSQLRIRVLDGSVTAAAMGVQKSPTNTQPAPDTETGTETEECTDE